MTSEHPLPRSVEMRRSPGDILSTSSTIKVMTMKIRKGLKFPVMALPSVVHIPGKGENNQEAVRVFYVAATWAAQKLVHKQTVF